MSEVYEVFINSLTIENFGPYYGKHTFEFESFNGKNAILIGGKTGAGKTHLLRAIYLAVVGGESGQYDLKKVEAGSEATKFDVRQSLNRRAKSEEKDTSILNITLSQRDTTGTIGRTLTLTRKIRHRPNSHPIFSSEAVPSYESYTEDNEKIRRLRDDFLPKHLARFFFFDAERGQSIQLAEGEITEGISRVLGLHSYKELEEDLRKLTQKIQNDIRSGGESERKLNESQADITKNIREIEISNSEIEDLKKEILAIQSKRTEIEEQLTSIGAVNPEDLEKAQIQKDEVTAKMNELQASLKEAWEMAIPLALLGNYRNTLHDYLISEEGRRKWENMRSSVEPKIPQVKQDVFENVPSDFELTSLQRTFYEKQVEQALKRIFDPPPEGISEKIFVIPERNELSDQVRKHLKTQLSEIKGLANLCNELERKKSEHRELEQKLKMLRQDKEVIQRGNELREKRGSLVQQQENAEKCLNEIQNKKSRIELEIQSLKREETILYENVQKIKKKRDISSLAHQYRESVSEITKKASIRLHEKISDIVGELWLDITDRREEYIGLEFDQQWNCFLNRRDGNKQTWESANTSAGQRQVRLLAFTEALRRLARLVPPLVVDTPLGRLDKDVKQNVLEKLYLTGHQSIILSTNAEIEPNSDLFKRISPQIARVYTLNPVGDPETHTYHVDVSPNYFKTVL